MTAASGRGPWIGRAAAALIVAGTMAAWGAAPAWGQDGGGGAAAVAGAGDAAGGAAAAAHAGLDGLHLSPLWVVPFALILLAIAILPLVAAHWWEHNRNKGIVVGVLALPVLGLVASGDLHLLGHTGIEYVSFIVLLGSLFVVSGGILVTGDIRATPTVNTAILGLGGLIANLIGTTGASMLLIRPLLRINSQRKHTVHSVVFFIFVVSNVGGCLTPLGDPPLFLGYLKGVPFAWTLNLWKEWAFMLAALLAVYWVLDAAQARKEAPADRARDASQVEPLRVHGALNFAFLAGVVLAVAFIPATPWREMVMLAMAAGSLAWTEKSVRAGNGFTFAPIVEVAVLFAGIFVAMIPALKILEARGSDLGVTEPWQFFWATGALSSFLDNAPTYLTFCSVAKGLHAASPLPGPTIPMEGAAVPENLLVAISLGAVFMGANTYIGNGPNFMVKAIAESAGQKMPSFFGYMLWSIAVLVPLFVVVTFLFL